MEPQGGVDGPRVRASIHVHPLLGTPPLLPTFAGCSCRLLSTFCSGKEEEERLLRSVALVPSKGSGGGVFRVRVGGSQIWDRKTDGGFPEAKVLKQRVRDIIAPTKNLGHSDVKTQ